MPGLPELEGRAAVVTGAASGIGLAITEAFVAAGMRVLMTDLDEARLAAHAERLRRGRRRGAVAGGRRDRPRRGRTRGRRRGRALRHAERRGEQRRHRRRGNSWELPLSEWHRVIDVDLWGVIHGIHAFVPRILASGEPG